MQLTVLGCHGPLPFPGGATSGYLLTHNGKNYLMDCGCGTLGKLVALTDPTAIRAVFLSHLHFDHMSDLLVMQYALMPQGIHTPVYLPGEDQSPQRAILDASVFEVHAWQDTQVIDGLTVSTLRVRHPVPCRALRISDGKKTLVFTGDTNTCDELTDFCRDADALLCDAAFLKDEWKDTLPHISAAHAGQIAAEAKVKALYLTHLPVRHAPETMEQEAQCFYPGAKAVHPGMIIDL